MRSSDETGLVAHRPGRDPAVLHVGAEDEGGATTGQGPRAGPIATVKVDEFEVEGVDVSRKEAVFVECFSICDVVDECDQGSDLLCRDVGWGNGAERLTRRWSG